MTAASGAAAQLGGGFPGGTGGMGGMGGKRGAGGNRDRGSDAKGGALETPRVNLLEVTLQELHEDLKLSQPQEYAWQTYADRLRALAGDIARQASPREAAAQMSVLQRIERTVDIARNRLTAVEDVADAAKSLYGMLTPEQKTAADPRLANVIAMTAAGPQGGQPQRAKSQ